MEQPNLPCKARMRGKLIACFVWYNKYEERAFVDVRLLRVGSVSVKRAFRGKEDAECIVF